MTQSTLLTIPETQTALRLAGLPPSPASPFARLSPPASIDPSVVYSLTTKNVANGNGALTADWRRALAVLASPSHRATIYLGSADQWHSIEYYAEAAGGLVGIAEAEPGSGYRVTFPGDRVTLLGYLQDWLQTFAMPDNEPYRVDLRIDELTALAAFADAFREENLRAFLDRREATLTRFSREQLLFEIEAGETADPRWLAGLLTRHAPASCRPAAARLTNGAGLLAARGWLRFENDLAVPDADLTAICIGLSNLNPHAVLGIDTAGSPGSLVLVMRSLYSFWMIEFLTAPDGMPWARLHGLGSSELTEFLRRILDTLPAAPPPAASWTAPAAASWGDPPPPVAIWNDPAPPPPPPAATWSDPAPPPPPVRPQQRPPERQPVPPPAPAERLCSKCGKAIPPGKPFCTRCGTPVG